MDFFRWSWDPWSELRQLREEVDAAARRIGRTLGIEEDEAPPVNVHQDDDGVTVVAELPGVSAEGLSVELEGDRLRLSGSRPQIEGVKDEQYHRRERTYGEFSRELRMPAGLDPERIEARLADGILTVRLPKAEAARPRKIAVKTA